MGEGVGAVDGSVIVHVFGMGKRVVRGGSKVVYLAGRRN